MSVFLGLVLGFGVSNRPHLEPVEVPPFLPLTESSVDLEAEAREQATDPEADAWSESSEDIGAGLALESLDVEDPHATAEAIEHESFEWPEPESAFEPAEAESGASHDGLPAIHAGALDDADASWMREHGSD
jgi:hypothetical protein